MRGYPSYINMNLHTRKIVAALALGAVLLPAAAFAESTTTAQIQALLAQIKALQEQVRVLQGSVETRKNTWTASSTPPGQVAKMWCITLNRDLSVGAQGDDVRKLQEMLRDDDDKKFDVLPTGFFGPKTLEAMKHYQRKHGIASTTTGVVGPLTRGFFERRCGKGLGDHDDKREKVLSLSGTISSSNGSNMITVLTKGDDLRTVTISASTTIEVFTATSTPPTGGTMSDLIVGRRVQVEGAPGSNNSLVARKIRVGTLLPPPLKLEGHHKTRTTKYCFSTSTSPSRTRRRSRRVFEHSCRSTRLWGACSSPRRELTRR